MLQRNSHGKGIGFGLVLLTLALQRWIVGCRSPSSCQLLQHWKRKLLRPHMFGAKQKLAEAEAPGRKFCIHRYQNQTILQSGQFWIEERHEKTEKNIWNVERITKVEHICAFVSNHQWLLDISELKETTKHCWWLKCLRLQVSWNSLPWVQTD